MCGLLGWIQLEETDEQMQAKSLADALKECSTRGLDATGFYSPNHGVWKYPIGAYELSHSKKDDLNIMAEQTLLIAHCRSASHGKNVWASRDNNNNNHPHEGERWVVTHNGWFGELPRIKDYAYKGECDSEIFVSYLETFGLEKTLQMQVATDKFALVIYDKQENQIYFYRHTNPIVYTYDSVRKCMVWGSTFKIVRCLDDVDQTIHGIKNGCQSTVWELPEHELYTIDDEGNFKFLKTISPMYNYNMRNNKFSEELKLTFGEPYNRIKEREEYEKDKKKTEDRKVLPFDDARVETDLKASVKKSVFLMVGMVGNDLNQSLKLFPPLFPSKTKVINRGSEEDAFCSEGAVCLAQVM